MFVGQADTVTGDITATGNVRLDDASKVTGKVTSSAGSVTLVSSNATVTQCVTTPSSQQITLNWNASVGGVCCLADGLCNTACVANASGKPIPAACANPATLIAQYRMEDAGWNGTSGELKDTAGYTGGPFNGVAIGTPVPTPTFTAPAKSGSTGTCGYATMPGLAANGGAFSIPNLPVSTVAGAKTSVAFWMYWNGTFGVMPIGWNRHDLWLSGGSFGFNTANSGDIYGIASTGLAGGWHHVVAVFTNGGVTSNELYIDGVRQTLTQRTGSPNNASALVQSTLRIGGWAITDSYRFTGLIDEVKVYNGAVTQAQVTALHSETHACPATVVAEWRMDELAWNGSAGEIKDSAGSNPATAKEYTSLTPLLGLPTTENAKLCKGGRFRGDWNESPVQGHANFYLDAPDADSLSPLVDSREMTLAGWFKLSSESGTILYKGEGWTAQEYQVYSSGGGKLTAIAWDKWGRSVSLDIPGVTVGKWHFFAVTITATGTSASMVGHLFDESGRVGGPVSPGVLSNPGSFDISGKTTPGSFVMGMGKTTTTTFGSPMSGWLDEIKVVDRALTQSQIEAGWANESAGKNWNGTARSCPVAATLIAQYRMEDTSWNGTSGELKDTAGYTGGPFNGVAIGTPVPTPTLTAPAKSGSPGTCGYATMPGPAGNGGAFSIPNLPVSTVAGAKTSVAFWMYWNGTFGVMPIGWSGHDLYLSGGHFGFNTASSDIYGIASAGLAGGWHHVVAVFTNGSVTSNELYIDGDRQTLTQRLGIPSNTNALVQSTLRIGGWERNTSYRLTGRIDEVKVYNGAVTQAQVTALHSETHACPATVVAEWRMDELAWNGTAGEVQDSSGNNLNGWTVAGASTASAKICQGGVFDNQSYAEIPDSAALQLATAYSVAAWIKTDKASGTIVSKTAASSPWSGYVFAIGPDSGGKLALWNGTGSWNTSSGAAVNDGAWHHVVASVNGTSLQFYVDGAPNGSAIALSGTTTASTSPLRIGYENNAGGASRYFSGQIDELMVFSGALTTAEVAAGYANQNAGKNWNGTARSCPTSFDHIRIEHNGTGLTCQREPVKIKACKDATCTALSTESVSLKLSPTGKWWPVATGGTQTDAVTLASGTATVYLQSSAAGTVTVGAIDVAPDPHPASGDKVKCYNGTTQTCDIVFADAGLIFTADNTTGAEATIPTQTSGKASGNYYLRAVKTDNTSGTCTAAVDGSRTVAFSYACIDPNACIADKMTIANTAVASSGTNVTLNFDANGYSPAFTFRFDDAGKIGLDASTTSSTGGALKGSSKSFVVKPAGLCVYSTALSTCAAADATCGTAKKAGEAFNLTVRGVTWESDTDSDLCTAGNVTTPNYKATGIVLGSSLVAPTGGSAGSVGVNEVSITTNGWAAVDQTISEVGVFKFSAAPPAYIDSVKLGGDTEGKFWTGALGRFYPDHFDVTVGGHGKMAAACNSFTYTGQPMVYGTAPSLTIKPMNALATPTVTTNYVGGFQKLAASGVSITAPTADTTQKGKDGNFTVLAATLDAGALANSNGTMTYTLAVGDKYTYTRNANSLIAPYTSAIGLVATAVKEKDGDDVAAAAGTLPTLKPTGIPVRYGRARLLNANGSELLRLPLPLRLEYFSGATQGWQTNAADTCTTIAADNFAFAFPAGTTAKPNNLAACEMEMTMSGSAPNYTLTLEAPGAGNTGWTNVTLNLGAAAAGGSCTVVGAATATTATAPWLRYNWTGAEDNPTARATFGVFRSGPVIHMREFY